MAEAQGELKSDFYPLRHWRGELGLAQAFWGNGILLNMLTWVIIAAAGGLGGGLDAPAELGVGLALESASAALLTWQIVGVWRSAGRYRRSGGALIWLLGARGVTALWAVAAVAIVGGLWLPMARDLMNIARGDPDYAIQSIRVLAEGRELEYRGGIPQGGAERLREALAAAPGVKVVRLDSSGGRLVEAKRMQDLIRGRKLDTYVEGECLSACGRVFLGGVRRYLDPKARIGFHGPKGYGPGHERLAAQVTLEATLLGVEKAFAHRMYETPNEEAWFPTPMEALDARFATGLSSGGLAANGEIFEPPDRSFVSEWLASQPIIRVVAKVEGEAFAEMVELFRENLVGRNGEAGKQVGAILRALKISHLERMTAPALVAYTEAVAEHQMLAARIDPVACGGGGVTDPRLQDDRSAMVEKLLQAETGDAVPPISGSEVASIGQAVRAIAVEASGEFRDLARKEEVGSLSGADNCRYNYFYYRAALELPEPDRARVLRHLLVEGR